MGKDKPKTKWVSHIMHFMKINPEHHEYAERQNEMKHSEGGGNANRKCK